MSVEGYDFSGWATKNDLRCSDGLVIKKGAFSSCNGRKVPLIWNHRHNSPTDVLGHAMLEERDEGIYAYGYFNRTPAATAAKESLLHGDVVALSIYANNLEKNGRDVVHGAIRELSLVLAGANPGAFIESVIAHNEPMDPDDDEGIFYTGENIELYHADGGGEEENKNMETENKKTTEKTVGEIYESLTDEQKDAVAVIVGAAIEDATDTNKKNVNKEDDEDMRHSIFDEGKVESNYLSHSDMETIFKDAKKCGSLKEAAESFIDNNTELRHALDMPDFGLTEASGTQTYGFNDPSILFPDYKAINSTPEWISRRMEWVAKVMNGVRRTPFSRIKSLYADITEDEARAKGYIKGKMKKEEVFTTLKRTTDPQTIYKKQKLDRDDVIDITDFDVVAWIKAEMRVMLDEEIARAILIGDGRASDSDDKIQENHIRPIVNDSPLFTIKVGITYNDSDDINQRTEYLIDEIIRARKDYKGSGTPDFWTTEEVITEMLLVKDKLGHRMYKTKEELATTLRVGSIIPVDAMEGAELLGKGLIGVVVNMADYTVGADKGGAISLFDDFDIDYNQMKYLIETRISGALTKPKSAIVFYVDGIIQRDARSSNFKMDDNS